MGEGVVGDGRRDTRVDLDGVVQAVGHGAVRQAQGGPVEGQHSLGPVADVGVVELDDGGAGVGGMDSGPVAGGGGRGGAVVVGVPAGGVVLEGGEHDRGCGGTEGVEGAACGHVEGASTRFDDGAGVDGQGDAVGDGESVDDGA